ncbi:MAG: carbohydrate binding domain-containing protein [Verrucomicrobiae bacterium]|nr:carbohydrate binding domain-containing protein [Verrucomicrobiae bacterium]
MKNNPLQRAVFALLGVSAITHAAPVLIPNGDFSTPGGADFGFFESAVGVVSFPSSGGNTGGHALIDNTIGSWGGGLVSPPDNTYPGNLGIPLANLGLVAGETYTFSMDMKNFAGTGTGGLKLEAWNDVGFLSSTGDVPATGSSSDWATYEWTYTIPSTATSLKIVPLVTAASGGSTADSVGFDNIMVDNTPVEPPPVVPIIPNSGFEIQPPADTKWSYFSDGFGLTWNTTGGNPDGNVVIDATLPGNYAVLVANNNAPQTLESLGLTAGETYTFQLDMKVLSGSNPGGIKVEFVPGASGDLRYDAGQIAALPNPITDWNTYSFEVTLPPTCTQIQVVPLWGPGSIVAYDNVKILLPVPPGNPQPSIALGTMVNWTPTAPTSYYQAQESDDNSVWTDLGPSNLGTAVSSIFDPTPAPFYRVQESAPVVAEASFNGGFEEEFFGEPDGWTLAGSQLPTYLDTDPHTDTYSVKIAAAATEDTESPGTYIAAVSIIEQNTKNAGGPDIVPGNTYDFSFWAKQLSLGPGFVGQYKVTWLNGSGAIMGDGGVQVFSGAIGVWEQKTQNGLVAPAGSVSAQILIQGVTGAFDGSAGEVIIDDISLATTTAGTPSTIASSSASAAEISWQSVTGQSYQLRSSIDLSGWSPFGGVITGDNTMKAVYDSPLTTKKFYQLGTE